MLTSAIKALCGRGSIQADHRQFIAFVPVYRSLTEAMEKLGVQDGLPEFNNAGNLPVGMHRADLPTFQARFGWNRRRRHLLTGLARQLAVLRICGCRRILMGGSLLSTKRWPGDFEGCWDGEGVDRNLLYRLEPRLLAAREHDIGELNACDGGSLVPWRYIESLSVDYAVFLQFDTRAGERKGVALVDI